MWRTSMSAHTRILLVDGQALIRLGVRTLLSHEADLAVVGETDRGAEAVRIVTRLQPDVVILDLRLPDNDGLELIRQIRQLDRACGILVLTDNSEAWAMREAIAAGALGYLLKDVLPAELIRAVRAVARAEPTLHPEAQRVLMRQTSDATMLPPPLTQREMDVLRLITQGKRNKEIARSLYLTEGTVKGYISAILAKLSVDDRTQAALYAVKHRLVVEQ